MMMRRWFRPAALCTLALTALGARPLTAQLPGASLSAGAGFERYTFAEPAIVGIRSVSLLTVPIALQPVATRTLQVMLSGAFASGTVERVDGSTATLSGPTDIELRATVSPQRFFGVSAALLLPTGQSTHTAEEAEVAGIIAADLLPFRVSNWGSGGGADVSATIALPAGPLNVGARLGYQVAREFEPLEAQPFVYRPGNQLYGRLAVDYNVGRAGKASAHVTVQQFDADELDGSNLYQSGNRMQVIGSYAFAAGARTSAVLYAGALHRARPTVFGQSIERPTQDLLLAGGGMRLPTAIGVLAPSVDLRVFRSEDGFGQGYTAGFGTAAEMPLGSGGVRLAPSVRVRIGRIVVSEGNESGLTGIDAGFGIRFGRAVLR